MYRRSNDNASNVNVERFSKKRNDNDNYNDNAKYSRARRVEVIADQLVDIFDNQQGRAFYCKVAYRLSESRIWSNVERAKAAKKGAPVRLFTYLCKVDGV